MSRSAYTSTTVAPLQVAAGVVVAAALLVANASVEGPTWLAIVCALLAVVSAVHVATVRLSVGSGRVVLGQGPWPTRGRVIDAGSVLAAEHLNLSRAQVFGIPMPRHRRTTRMSIRPGPTLALTLRDGEHIVISTPDPDTAIRLLPTLQEDTP